MYNIQLDEFMCLNRSLTSKPPSSISYFHLGMLGILFSLIYVVYDRVAQKERDTYDKKKIKKTRDRMKKLCALLRIKLFS